jgi:cobyrinic acid a,c-diamide synthase
LREAAGAELVKFSPLNDQVLPDVDKLYLGGGYLELHGRFD